MKTKYPMAVLIYGVVASVLLNLPTHSAYLLPFLSGGVSGALAWFIARAIYRAGQRDRSPW